MSDNRPAIYTENGITIYRASALGLCPRALVAIRRGLEPRPFPQSVLKAFSDGDKYEPIIINAVKKKMFVMNEQAEVELSITPTIKIRGHIDFNSIDDNELTRVEDAKALSNDNYNAFIKDWKVAFPHYTWQISVYMLAQGLSGGFFILNKETKKLAHVTVNDPPYSKVDIFKRILLIEKLAQESGYPECEKSSFFCQFQYLHDDKTADILESESSDLKLYDDVLAGYCKQLMVLKDTVTRLNKQKDEITDQIKSRIPTNKTDYVLNSMYKINILEMNAAHIPHADLVSAAKLAGVDLDALTLRKGEFNYRLNLSKIEDK